jgi:hypothetical protein
MRLGYLLQEVQLSLAQQAGVPLQPQWLSKNPEAVARLAGQVPGANAGGSFGNVLASSRLPGYIPPAPPAPPQNPADPAQALQYQNALAAYNAQLLRLMLMRLGQAQPNAAGILGAAGAGPGQQPQGPPGSFLARSVGLGANAQRPPGIGGII